MKQEAEKIAKIIRQRDNPKVENLVIGTVVGLNPLTVSDTPEILLDNELIITYTVRQHIQSNELQIGNKVAMLSDGQRYLVIDKVV